MFIPLYDGQPVRFIGLQWVTVTLIAINVLVFVLALPFDPGDGTASFIAVAFGHVPSVSYDTRVLPEAMQLVPDPLYFTTAISYAFIHADWWHLGGNMLFLWVFGDNVEDALGHFKFLVFYLAAAFLAAWFHALVFPASDAPLIGASGAAAAIVAAYLMLHPKTRIWGLVLGRIPLRLPAIWLLGAWILFQVFMFLTDSDNQVSWACHVGGIMAGVVMVVFLKRRDVALFDRNLAHPDVIEPEAIEAVAEKPLAHERQKPSSASPWGRQKR